MAKPKIKSDGRTITVRVPISIRKRGGRKVVLAPDGAQTDPRKLFCQRVDNAMVKALARSFRWRELLERGEYATIVEIADTERINSGSDEFRNHASNKSDNDCPEYSHSRSPVQADADWRPRAAAISVNVDFSASLTATPPKPRKPPSVPASAAFAATS